MSNNALRIGCGNKIVYISQKGPKNLQEGRTMAPGLGIRDECCGCECACEAGCKFLTTSDWFDWFDQDFGTDLLVQYTQSGQPWYYTEVDPGRLRMTPAGEGSLMIPGSATPAGEYPAAFTGQIEPSETAGAVQSLSLKMYGDIGNDLHLEILAAAIYEQSTGIGKTQINIEAGGATAFAEFEWINVPFVYLSCRARWTGDDELSICFWYDAGEGGFGDYYYGTPTTAKSTTFVLTDTGGDGKFGALETTFAGTVSDGVDSVVASHFCCPFSACRGSFECIWEEPWSSLDTNVWVPVATPKTTWSAANGLLRADQTSGELGYINASFASYVDIGFEFSVGDIHPSTTGFVNFLNNKIELTWNSTQWTVTIAPDQEFTSSTPLSPGDKVSFYVAAGGGACVEVNGVQVLTGVGYVGSVPAGTFSYRLTAFSGIANTYVNYGPFCSNRVPENASPQLAAISFSGPGAAARSLFQKYECDGRSYVHTMNNNGWEWCRENIELIVSWIERTAKLKKRSFNKEEITEELHRILDKENS